MDHFAKNVILKGSIMKKKMAAALLVLLLFILLNLSLILVAGSLLLLLCLRRNSYITAVNIAVMFAGHLVPISVFSNDSNLVTIVKNFKYIGIVICCFTNIEEVVNTYCALNLISKYTYCLSQNHYGSQNC